MKIQIVSLKNWFLIFFDLYFFTFCGSAASNCSLKVAKPPESFKIEAKYAYIFFPQFDPHFSVWKSGVLATRPWEVR